MKRLFVIFGLIWCVSALAEETIPPAPAHHFNDYTSVVSAATASRLDTLLENYERQSSDQIVVAIFPKMQTDAPIKDYTLRIANSWKVGQKGKNNGVSLFLFVQEHKMYIQVGTGFEKVLSDATCKQILDTNVSGRSKPAREGRMKTSHFEGHIASSAADAALGRHERTQCELTTFDFDFGGVWLVPPADCA